MEGGEPRLLNQTGRNKKKPKRQGTHILKCGKEEKDLEAGYGGGGGVVSGVVADSKKTNGWTRKIRGIEW